MHIFNRRPVDCVIPLALLANCAEVSIVEEDQNAWRTRKKKDATSICCWTSECTDAGSPRQVTHHVVAVCLTTMIAKEGLSQNPAS